MDKEDLNNTINMAVNQEPKKKGKKLSIIFLLLIILSIGGYVTYDKVLKDRFFNKEEKKSKDKKKDDIKEKKSEVPETISRGIDELWSTDFIDDMHDTVIEVLNLKDNDVDDVKLFLENNYNDFIIFTAYSEIDEGLSGEKEVTKKQILDKAKEMFGYDFDLRFHDIEDKITGEVGLTWHNATESYTHDTVGFHRGCDFFCDSSQVLIKVLDIKNNGDDTYTVTTNQLWTDWEIGKECSVSGNYYASVKDMNNGKTALSYTVSNNEIGPKEFSKYYKTNDECNVDALSISDYLFEQAKGKLNKYEYKVKEENGKIKILSFKKVS